MNQIRAVTNFFTIFSFVFLPLALFSFFPSNKNHQSLRIKQRHKEMAPSDYIAARGNEQEPRVTIDGQIYLPFLSVDPTNHDSIKRVVGEIFGLEVEEWGKLTVRTVTGGITNKLFQVSGSSKIHNSSVLVRVFGGHGMIDRDTETATYAALAKQNIALGYFGRFENGRLEEWCDEPMKNLEVDDLGIPEISLSIAKALAEMHSSFQVPPDLQKHHDPSKPPTLWTQLTDWLQQALNSKFQNDHDTSRASSLQLPLLKNELEWLQSSVVSSSTAKVGFCHNDLLAANILWDGKRIQLIDFEYGGINYLSYDIANHFNEFAGGTDSDATPDYSKFPSPQLQRDFCKTYLSSTMSSGEPTKEQVDALLREIKGFGKCNLVP